MEEKYKLSSATTALVKRSRQIALEHGYRAVTTLFFLMAYLEDQDGVLRDFFLDRKITAESLDQQLLKQEPLPEGTDLQEALEVGHTWREAIVEAAFRSSPVIEPYHFILAALEIEGSACRQFFAHQEVGGYRIFQDFLLKKNVIQHSRRPWSCENELEKWMLKSFEEPAFFPDFFKTLVNSDVIFLNQKKEGNPGQAGEDVMLFMDGHNTIPFFTSIKRVTDNGGFIGEFSMYSAKFGDLVKEFSDPFPTVILNPSSFIRYNMLPEEVERFSRGQYLSNPPADGYGPDVVSDDDLLSLVSDEIKSSIALFSKTRSEIKTIYAAMLWDKNKKPKALLIWHDIARRQETILGELKTVARGYTEPEGIAVGSINITSNLKIQPEYLVYTASSTTKVKEVFSRFFTAREN